MSKGWVWFVGPRKGQLKHLNDKESLFVAAHAVHILQKARASLLYNTVLSADKLIT